MPQEMPDSLRQPLRREATAVSLIVRWRGIFGAICLVCLMRDGPGDGHDGVYCDGGVYCLAYGDG